PTRISPLSLHDALPISPMPFGSFDPMPMYTVPKPRQPEYVANPTPAPVPRRPAPQPAPAPRPVERPREPEVVRVSLPGPDELGIDRKSTRLNSSHSQIS